MSATVHRDGALTAEEAGPVVDLREPHFSIPSPTPEPVTGLRRDPREVLRRRRRLLVVAVLAVAAAVVLQFLVGTLMAGQRQRHLAQEVTVPDARITPGEATMILQAPSIGLNVVVAEGASSQELRGGPGRVIGTAELTDGGNVVVLGRRHRFGASFERLGELAKGDSVVARSRAGVVRTYTVETVGTVSAASARPLTPGEDRLTLVTSGPGLLPDRRLVVVARATAPPPAVAGAQPSAQPGAAPTPPARPKLSVDALDERSSGAVGVAAGLALLVVAAVGGALGVRRLRQSYSPATVVQVVAPMVGLLLVVLIVVSDAVLPATY